MAHARTQRGAAYRVKLKHDLRKRGIRAEGEARTRDLEVAYKANIGKLPSRNASLEDLLS